MGQTIKTIGIVIVVIQALLFAGLLNSSFLSLSRIAQIVVLLLGVYLIVKG